MKRNGILYPAARFLAPCLGILLFGFHFEVPAQPAPLDTEPAWVSEGEYRSGALAWGDVDADGDLDLVSGNYCFQPMCYPDIPQKTHLYLNSGGMLETAPSWVSDDERWTADLAWADFNADGYLDIFAANGGPSRDPNVIYVNRDGALETTPSWVSLSLLYTLSVSIADINADGYPDAAVTNQCYLPCTGAPSHVYYSEGGLLSAAPDWSSADEAQNSGIALGDIDADGLHDAAESADGDGAKKVFHVGHAPVHRLLGATVDGAEAGTFTFDRVSGWISFAEAPRAGSGNVGFEYVYSDDLDLAVSENPGRNKVYLFGDGRHETAASWTSQEPGRTNSVVQFVDIDNDGDLDLFVAGRSHPCVIYENANGVLFDPPSWSTERSDPDVHDAAFADIDGDGFFDLATANYGADPDVSVFMNRGGSLEKTPSWTLPRVDYNASSLAWGDMNGDGMPDLAVAYVTGPVKVFLNKSQPAAPAPLLCSITPDSGFNDLETPVSLSGENFRQGAQAVIAGESLAEVAVISSTELTGLVPRGIAPGVYDVILRNPDFQSAVLPQAFEVLDAAGKPDAGASSDGGKPAEDAGPVPHADEALPDAGLGKDAAAGLPDAASLRRGGEEGCACTTDVVSAPAFALFAILLLAGAALIRFRSRSRV